LKERKRGAAYGIAAIWSTPASGTHLHSWMLPLAKKRGPGYVSGSGVHACRPLHGNVASLARKMRLQKMKKSYFFKKRAQ
jgi:hypothetical protein